MGNNIEICGNNIEICEVNGCKLLQMVPIPHIPNYGIYAPGAVLLDEYLYGRYVTQLQRAHTWRVSGGYLLIPRGAGE